MENITYLTEAYTSCYYAFIKKAMDCLDGDRDKAFDCLQEIVLRLLTNGFQFESLGHARAVIFKSISWECHHIKNLRKKWGAREDEVDFTSGWAQETFTEPVEPNIRGTLNYWPQGWKHLKHISKLNPYQQTIIKLTLQGYGNTEIKKVLNLKALPVSIGRAKFDAITMIKNFRVASTLRSPLERSRLRQGNDDRTDRIMEMTKQGKSNKEIAEQLGLSVGNVKCRRFDRLKLLKKLKQQ